MIVSNSSVIASGFVSLQWGTENNPGRSSTFGSPTTTDYLPESLRFLPVRGRGEGGGEVREVE